jgi:hypothetical protein
LMPGRVLAAQLAVVVRRSRDGKSEYRWTGRHKAGDVGRFVSNSDDFPRPKPDERPQSQSASNCYRRCQTQAGPRDRRSLAAPSTLLTCGLPGLLRLAVLVLVLLDHFAGQPPAF